MKRSGTSSKKQKIICSCCRQEQYDSNFTKTLGRKVTLWGTTTVIERDLLRDERFNLACDNCLDSKKAVVGNPAAQVYRDYDPYLAYFDIDKVCEKCDTPYVFRKEEQRYWYESLKFWVQSKPKHCPKCRAEIREEKALNRERSEKSKSPK